MKKKIIILFLVISFAIIFVAYLTDKGTLHRYLKESVLKTTVGYMHHIDEIFSQTASSIVEFNVFEKKLLRQMLVNDSNVVLGVISTYDSLVRNGLLDEKEAEDAVLSYLKGYKLHKKEFLFVVDENGRAIFSSGKIDILKFKGVFLKAGKRSIDYFYNGKIYSIGWGIYDPWGWKVGVLACQDDIKEIFPSDFLKKRKKVLIERLVRYLGKNYFLALYDDKGEVIAYSYGILGKDDLPSSAVMKKVFSQKYGYFFYQTDGVEKLKVFNYYPLFGYYVVLTAYPQRELLPVLWRTLKEILYPLAVVVLVVILIALWFLNRMILKPLMALREGFEELKARHYGYHLDVPATGEVREVIDSFNEMSDAMRLSYEELEAAYGELEAINSELEEKQFRLEKERERFRLLVEISNRTVALNDKKEIAQIVVEVLMKEKGYKNIDISLLKDGYLIPLAFRGYSIDFYEKMPADIGIRGWAVSTKEQKNVPDVSKEPHYFEGDPSIKSEISCPIVYNGKVIGIIDVESEEPAAFDKDDEKLFRLIAHYLAVAFRKVELLNEWQDRTKELRFALSVIKSISKSNSIREVAELVINKLVDERGYRNAIFYIRKGEKLFMVHSRGYKLPDEGSLPEWAELRVDGPSIISRAARLKKVQNVADVRTDPNYIEGDPSVRSELTVPVLLENEIVGVLDVEDTTVGAFDEMDERFVSTMADAMAIVVHKTSIIEELEASLNQIESYAQIVEEKRQEIERAYLNTIRALSKTIEMKDPYTEGHSNRVARYSIKIAKLLGISEKEKTTLLYAALLHDIGKIGIRGAILNKNGKLTSEEYEEIKRHPVIGATILKEVKYLKDIVPVVLHHHERWDGNGYPDGLKGEEIPLLSRIISVADAYDAMTSDRPYRKAFSKVRAVEEIRKNMGTQFDPKVAKVFIEYILNLQNQAK